MLRRRGVEGRPGKTGPSPLARLLVGRQLRSLVDTWGLVEQRGKRGDTRYTLSAEGIRYVTHRDSAQLPTTRGIWSTTLTTDRPGRRRHVGARRRHHVVPLEAGGRGKGRPRQRPAVVCPHRQIRSGLQLGRFGHRSRRRWRNDRREPSDTILLRVRATRQASPGSPCRRVGRRRVTPVARSTFPSAPSEPDVRLSPHPALQWSMSAFADSSCRRGRSGGRDGRPRGSCAAAPP